MTDLQPVPEVSEEPLLPGSIETYLATEVPVCLTDDRAGDVLRAMAGRRFDSADDVAVCDTGAQPRRLLGLVTMERLLAADPAAPVATLMDPDPPVVAPGLSQERAAWKAVQHGESTLAVADADGHFRGLVPPARLLGVLLRHHDQDFARIGGYLHDTETARRATEEPLRQRLWHRLPWLLLGLVGSAVAAWLVRGFEAELSEDVRLAFFIPGVVYMADAVGTQTEALVIRGMSVGASVSRAFRLEALTGLMMGLLLGGATFVAVWSAFGAVELAAAVAVALLCACAVATLVAMSLPWLMRRAGRDPAFGSGPLATVVQDLLSLVIYFAVASALVG